MAYTPILGGSGSASFPRQFEDSSVDPISMAVTPIEHLANDGSEVVLSHGTGFFWRDSGRTFLVTARHVISGTEPFADTPMSANGFIPQRVRIFPSFQEGGNWSRSDGVTVNLYADDRRLWLQDPEFENLRTDIAALEVRFDYREGQALICLNEQLGTDRLITQVGFECSIVGYPTTNLSGLRTPVWRKGALSSEPFLPVDGKPMFLVDGTTSPGFSGSPVLRRHIGPAPVRAEDGSITILADRVVSTIAIGVYVGRLQHRHIGGEVPFAFYANRIPLIIQRPMFDFTNSSFGAQVFEMGLRRESP